MATNRRAHSRAISTLSPACSTSAWSVIPVSARALASSCASIFSVVLNGLILSWEQNTANTGILTLMAIHAHCLRLSAILTGLFAAAGVCAQTLEPVLDGVDVYGTDRFDAADLRAAFPDLFDQFPRLMVAQDTETVGPMMDDLKAWIDARGPFAFTEIGTQAGPGPGNQLLVRIGIDVVEPEDVARRMPFREPPGTALPDPDGVLALWGEYEAKGMGLLMSGGLPSENSNCPVLHCAFYFDHPELAPYLARLNAGAAAHRDELFRIAEESSNPEHRAQAIFLLAHAADAESLLPLLGRAIYDENSTVRNNAMRVMMHLAMTDPSLPYPIESLAAALDFPSESDRNKAAYCVRMTADHEGHRAAIRAAAVPNLLKVLRSERPNIHDPAYETLKILSGRDYADRDYAAWEDWAAE